MQPTNKNISISSHVNAGINVTLQSPKMHLSLQGWLLRTTTPNLLHSLQRWPPRTTTPNIPPTYLNSITLSVAIILITHTWTQS